MEEESESFAWDAGDFVQFVSIKLPRAPLVEVDEAPEPSDAAGWNAPTVDDLNDETDREFDWTGVEETTEEDRARLEPDTERGRQIARSDEARLRELGIYRMMAMDVRGDPETEDRREWRRR